MHFHYLILSLVVINLACQKRPMFFGIFFFSAENEKNLLEISGEFQDQREREKAELASV